MQYTLTEIQNGYHFVILTRINCNIERAHPTTVVHDCTRFHEKLFMYLVDKQSLVKVSE